ncbi:carbohydrate-binding module family 18 protein [Teratosphaeria destructans]|uniref:Carbohydrate-binding module family 18 protein n=1 Tax=Teratosphaeria destructans TaxID=418781 RepID=A0A9W7T1M3_9PEZI|nr:carbohydrate-binding module family 18 protein [Teratosphaeria destructans]
MLQHAIRSSVVAASLRATPLLHHRCMTMIKRCTRAVIVYVSLWSPSFITAKDQCAPSTWSKGSISRRRTVNSGTEAESAEAKALLDSTGIEIGQINCRYSSTTSASVNYYTCFSMAARYGIEVDHFFHLNPDVILDCSNVQPKTEYCVDGSDEHQSLSPNELRTVSVVLSMAMLHVWARSHNAAMLEAGLVEIPKGIVPTVPAMKVPARVMPSTVPTGLVALDMAIDSVPGYGATVAMRMVGVGPEKLSVALMSVSLATARGTEQSLVDERQHDRRDLRGPGPTLLQCPFRDVLQQTEHLWLARVGLWGWMVSLPALALSSSTLC